MNPKMLQKYFGAGILWTKPFDYYVDSVNGLDTNSGTSPSSAFKTISALTGKIVAGVRIGLACGSSWKEKVNVAADNVRVGAYGTGNKPVLDCSDAMTNANFVKSVGYTNIYEYSATTDYWGGENFQSVWVDNVRLVLVANLALCDSTPGSYYVTTHATATPLFYIHSTGSTNPITDSKVYEYSARQGGITTFYNVATPYSGLYASGIQCKRNLSTSGSIICGNNTTLIDCRASEGNKHNFYYGCGSHLIDCLADEAYYAGLGSTLYIMNTTIGNGSGAIHDACTASLSVYDSTNQGFSGHINTSGTLGEVTFNNCSVSNCGQGFSLLDGTTIVNYNDCIMTGCARGFTIAKGTVHNINRGSYTYGEGGQLIYTSTNALTINIDGITEVVDSFATSGNISLNVNGTILNISNSTLTDNKADESNQRFIVSTNLVSINSNNNYFKSPNFLTPGIYVYRLTNAASTVVSDYNKYQKGTFYYDYQGVTKTSLVLWQGASGQDAHSTVG